MPTELARMLVNSQQRKPESLLSRHGMVLDSHSLWKSLRILRTGPSDTLLEKFETGMATPFGKRLMKQWLSAPLCSIPEIEQRLDAVEFLLENMGDVQELRADMKVKADLERLLTSLHGFGSSSLAADHPMNRAIMYENEKYDRKKTAKLTAAVNGFARIIKAMETFSANMFDNCNSSLLKTLLRGSSAAKASSDGASAGTAGASVPDFSSLLEILRDIKARQNSSASSSDDPEHTGILSKGRRRRQNAWHSKGHSAERASQR